MEFHFMGEGGTSPQGPIPTKKNPRKKIPAFTSRSRQGAAVERACAAACIQAKFGFSESVVKREAVIAGLASEGLALILGSAGAGSSAVVGPMSMDPVEFRKCARDLKALSATKEYTNEERGGGHDPGARRPGAGRGQLPARSKIFRAAMREFFFNLRVFIKE